VELPEKVEEDPEMPMQMPVRSGPGLGPRVIQPEVTFIAHEFTLKAN